MASPLTQDVSVKEGPVWLPPMTAAGDLVLFDTTNPYVAQPVQFGCLVILASWLPARTPVAMFVTYNVFTGPGGNPVREVNTLFASEGFRGLADAFDEAGRQLTLPAAVGIWLIEHDLLQCHSADRTDRGDRWARVVGGCRPARVQSATDEATMRNGTRALERLNDQEWPDWREREL